MTLGLCAAARWWAFAMIVAASTTGCLYFDSRWVQNEAEKKRAAERLHPATLSSAHARSSGGRVALVRAYATRAYAAETVNWEKQFDSLLDDASAVLEPALGLSLENGGTSLWAPDSGETEPSLALDALARTDPGDDVQWVVGFLQSVPKLVTDYHKLAVGRYFSKYLVIRGSADPNEMEYLGKFEGVSETDRQKLYSERRHHKIVAVFLHELGHTLGAAHRTARDTLMSPIYDSKEKGFDATTLGLFRITLPDHLSGAPYKGAPAVLAYLEHDDGGWVGSERDAWINILKSALPSAARTSGATAAAASTTPSVGSAGNVASITPGAPSGNGIAPAAETVTALPFTSMPRNDRATFEAALRSEKNGDARAAWDTALPLFGAYPRVLEVQDLRCRLAKARRFLTGVIYAHCEWFRRLSGGEAKTE